MSISSSIAEANTFAQNNLQQGSQLMTAANSILSQASGLADCQAKLAQIQPQVTQLQQSQAQQISQYTKALNNDKAVLASLQTQFEEFKVQYEQKMTQLDSAKQMMVQVGQDINEKTNALQRVLQEKVSLSEELNQQIKQKSCTTQLYICYILIALAIMVHVAAFINLATRSKLLSRFPDQKVLRQE